MENNNDKSKTEKFTPMNKSSKPEINRSENDAYSEARRTPEYDFNDDGDDGNNKLVIVSVLLAVLLVAVIALSVFLIGATKREAPEEEQPPIENEEIIEEEVEKEKTGNYNIVFNGESIIEKNGYAIIDAVLYDDEMNEIKSKKIKISPETRIISGGESITKKSLIYLIENVVDEKIVFEGTIQEEDGLALRIYFEYEAEVVPEEETPEEPVLEDPPVENPEDITEEIPEQVPEENPGIPVE